jgi:hypothetical protein
MSCSEVVILDYDETQVFNERCHKLEAKRVNGPFLALLDHNFLMNVRFVVLDVRLVYERIDRA